MPEISILLLLVGFCGCASDLRPIQKGLHWTDSFVAFLVAGFILGIWCLLVWFARNLLP